ncbi:ABC transporter ATP-binding protein [Halomonas sp. Bachu 37]|uniref:ABC transporter ATP-binding protein n=1 Tax=Halomonas kashgarensis TaxID=3084920 RepID=UPI0032173D9C
MGLLEACGLVIDIPERSEGRALDIAFEPGQIWGVLGPNGAGKTTLLHTLAGLREPCSGSVWLDGKAMTDWRRRQVAQRLGVVFQERHDGFPATVRETALMGRHPFLSLWQREGDNDLQAVHDALRQLGIQHLAHRLVTTLSGGERQRLAFATVLAQNPEVWLADEPSNHLDLQHQTAAMQLLHRQAKAGCAVVMCLHDVNLAARWCDNLLLLYPDGEACWGPQDAMLTLDALERLYGQRLHQGEIFGKPVFMPAAGGWS